GVTEDAGDDGFENNAVVWSPDGEIVDGFTKVRRVPFGEYVPLRGLLDDLVDLSVLPRDAVAGDGDGTVDTPTGRFAVAISYEVFFSDRARSGVRAGGEVLLVPTNASSYTTSQVPTQEVAAAQLRAWETGRWVLQAAPTGYSAVIDERGEVLQRSVLGERELLHASVPRRSGDTVYVRLGDAPLLAVALAMIAAGRLRGWRR
ncbi:MAG TPA: apolipoprotein N-acyltransferase, partial [Acidimicrobiales bacterium]|nr:apolipoprotein N-acyltransferase [Acidimicrobiales bacterium]